MQALRDSVVSPVTVLGASVLLYSAVFGVLTWQQQSRFATFGFDMGIFDQGIWLVSRFREPFVTVRGLNYFGNHVNVITVLFVPFYWLGAGPHFLYLVETLALAAGAIPIWLLARDRLANGWLALGLSTAYLLNPSIEWVNWWHFHPDALAVTPLLFAYWLATKKRWGWFTVAALAALMCKEDAALALIGLGAVLAIRGSRREGGATAAVALLWFALCEKVIIPHANGGLGAFYQDFYGGLGNSVGEIAYNAVRHPSRILRVMTDGESRAYYKQLLGPFGYVPLAAPLVLLIALPHVTVNTISSFPNTHNIKFQYSALVTAALAIGAVEACAALSSRQGFRRFLVGLVAASALAGHATQSPSPLSRNYRTGIWAAPAPRQASAERAVHRVPRGAGVAASYALVPHLTHRVHIYEWPNPWIVANWGIHGEHPPNPRDVDYIVLDLTLNPENRTLFDSMVGPDKPFHVVFQESDYVVAKRVKRG
jgi:uncharacterized membrane protein